MSEPVDKRPIDRIRESALSMQVGEPEDGAICQMISIGNQLHIIAEHAVFAVQLADEIDPERTNESVPNTNQKILSRGAKDPVVGRILLTAHAMFKTSHLRQELPEQDALKLALDISRDISAMLDMHAELAAEITRITNESNAKVASDQSLALPAVGNLKSRCDAFAQKVGHVIDTMKALARLFYPDRLSRKWIDSLVRLSAEEHGDSEPLHRFMVDVRDRLLFMRDIRNMIEHPRDDAKIVVNDFRLTSELRLALPCVDIIRGEEPSSSIDMQTFLTNTTEELLSIAEMFIALLCGANADSFAGFPLLIVELPESRRPVRNPHQRISWGVVMNGEVQPLG